MSASVLLTSAALLGALAFFEPCTIATHALFSARAQRTAPRACGRDLLVLFFSRILLATGLLLLAVAITPSLQWPAGLASALLALAATLYIASRFFYIPVPHLEFHRLLPRATPLSPAFKLGLTLPACTLPLFATVAALAMTLDSLPAAAIAGILFAALFTLPTAVAAKTGLSRNTRSGLNIAARTSPFVTAALLYGGALFLWRMN